MSRDSLLLYWYFLRTFRNGPALIKTLRNGGYLSNAATIDEAVYWSGKKLIHPKGKSGLVGILVELLFRNAYGIGKFYAPRPGDVVVDLGAHVGVFAQNLLRRYQCNLVAIEPCRENFECLQRNLQGFDDSRVKIYNVAIGAGRGKALVKTPESTNRTHDARIIRDDNNSNECVDLLPLHAIFDLCQSPKVDFLKIDIEGSELEAFRGLDDSYLTRIQRIAMEYHDNLCAGTLDFLKQKLASTHNVTVVSEAPERGYGMLFAVLK